MSDKLTAPAEEWLEEAICSNEVLGFILELVERTSKGVVPLPSEQGALEAYELILKIEVPRYKKRY